MLPREKPIFLTFEGLQWPCQILLIWKNIFSTFHLGVDYQIQTSTSNVMSERGTEPTLRGLDPIFTQIEPYHGITEVILHFTHRQPYVENVCITRFSFYKRVKLVRGSGLNFLIFFWHFGAKTFLMLSFSTIPWRDVTEITRQMGWWRKAGESYIQGYMPIARPHGPLLQRVFNLSPSYQFRVS